MELEKYTMGIGDRFGQQGRAQLQAFIQAQAAGITAVPVWNKSYREHSTIGTTPAQVRQEADSATATWNWRESYYVDADHISLKNVDLFLDSSDFFTLDVADFTGQAATENEIRQFVDEFRSYARSITLPGSAITLDVTSAQIEACARNYLLAVQKAGKIYRRIAAAKGAGNFITEVSMDETTAPQTPVELLFILAAIAREGIPAQTVAPKFTGRFNKGVDYVGDRDQFAREFEQDLAVLAFAIAEFHLPPNLKLSVHSGSDKFSLYPIIKQLLTQYHAGLHLKTAGTTWLEELIGLAEADGAGLEMARQIYAKAYLRFDELCTPYATVIDIDPQQLPTPETVAKWNSQQYTNALRHDQQCPEYNPHFRQLLHVGYKVAAEFGQAYIQALHACEETVAKNVTTNLYDRHLTRIFPAA